MTRGSGKRQVVPRPVIAFAVVLFLVPGGIFFAKGLLTLIDGLSPRTTLGATLTTADVESRSSGDGTTTLYIVRGQAEDGRTFELNDRRVYDLAHDRLPMSVSIDRVVLTGRVVTVRSDFGTVMNVGGGDQLGFALAGLTAGALLGVVPFLLPWHPAARKRSKERGKAPPPVDRAALSIVTGAAVAIVAATVAWDLLR